MGAASSAINLATVRESGWCVYQWYVYSISCLCTQRQFFSNKCLKCERSIMLYETIACNVSNIQHCFMVDNNQDGSNVASYRLG